MALTEEQIKKRLGMPTAFDIYRIMGAKGLGKTGETYIMEKVAETLTGQRSIPDFTSAATTWGNDHEDEARKYYEHATGEKLSTCETITNGIVVGSPDRLVEDSEFGFEIKCPYNSGNHVKNLLLNNQEDLFELNPDHFWQIYTYGWLTGRGKWKYCSYDPRFKGSARMLILDVEFQADKMKLLQERATVAKQMIDEMVLKLMPNE